MCQLAILLPLSSPRRVFFTRRLYICLLTTSHKNYRSDLHKNFTKEVSFDKEVAIKFWKSSGLELDLGSFGGFLPLCKWGNSAYFGYYLRSCQQILMNFLGDGMSH